MEARQVSITLTLASLEFTRREGGPDVRVLEAHSDTDRQNLGGHTAVTCIVKPRFDVKLIPGIGYSDREAYSDIPAGGRRTGACKGLMARHTS